MKQKTSVLIIFLSLTLLLPSCSGGMSGTVTDAETGKPLEDAVVFVEWTKTKGGWTGLGYKETYKIVEKTTDKDGKFRVFGVLSPFVNPPTIVIYIKGYVAWRNDYIFPIDKKRQDFRWENGYEFKLEPFKKYSHSRHILFFSGDLSLSSTKLEKAYSWEISLARKEEEIAREKRKLKKTGEYTEEVLWKEIVDELYSQEGAN